MTNLPICLFVYISVFLSANRNVHLSSSDSSIHYRISLISKKLATWLVYLPSSCYWRIIVVMLIMQCLLIMCVWVWRNWTHPLPSSTQPTVHGQSSVSTAQRAASPHNRPLAAGARPRPPQSPPSPQCTVLCTGVGGTREQTVREQGSAEVWCQCVEGAGHDSIPKPGEISLSQLII